MPPRGQPRSELRGERANCNRMGSLPHISEIPWPPQTDRDLQFRSEHFIILRFLVRHCPSDSPPCGRVPSFDIQCFESVRDTLKNTPCVWCEQGPAFDGRGWPARNAFACEADGGNLKDLSVLLHFPHQTVYGSCGVPQIALIHRECSIILLEHAHKHCFLWTPAFTEMTTSYIQASFPRRRESREEKVN